MPNASARAQPLSSQSSWPGACASVSMANRQPASTARRSSRSGGSWRSGRQLISTATPWSRQAANTASGSKADSGRPRPASSRPVQCPSTSTCGLDTAATIRSVIGPAGIRRLGVHAGDHDIELAEQVVPLVERAVLEDVDLDAGQDAERGELGVQPADELELRAQQLGGQPGGHGQPRRVVGERDPLVADIAGRLGHLLGRAAAVRPVRVRVAVPAQRGPQRGRGPRAAPPRAACADSPAPGRRPPA